MPWVGVFAHGSHDQWLKIKGPVSNESNSEDVVIAGEHDFKLVDIEVFVVERVKFLGLN